MPRSKYRDLEERLIVNSYVEWELIWDGEPCWPWLGSLSADGYGRINIWREGRLQCLWAHRIAYEVFVGAIIEGLQLDHLCNWRRCINPMHLEQVLKVENLKRRDERKKP